MKKRPHQDFILSPITTLMQSAVESEKAFGNGMEMKPISEYVIKSLFLETTGFLEQKCKCICWELATDDYDFRYEWLSEEDRRQGEYSTYDSKNYVYKNLFSHIEKEGFSEDERMSFLESSKTEILYLFCNTPMESLYSRDYRNLFKRDLKKELVQFCSNNNMFFQNVMQKEFENLYNYRNRCAHNTVAYQKNIPDFKSIREGKFNLEYFTWFYILNAMDKVYIELFKEYEKSMYAG